MERRSGKVRASSSQNRVKVHHISSSSIAHLPRGLSSSKNLLIRSHFLSGHQSSVYTAKPSTRRAVGHTTGVFGTKIGTIKPSMLISPHTSLGDLSIPIQGKEKSLTMKRSESQVITMETTRLMMPLVSQPLRPLEKPSLPLSPAELLSFRSDELAPYEIAEITAYDKVYFLGALQTKRQEPMFDNDQGDYTLVLGEHFAYRYEVLEMLGKGSFGVVAKCLDHKRKEEVAIKVIKNKKLFHQQGAVEVKILQAMRENNKETKVPIVTIKASFVFRKHLCIAFEMLNRSLYDFMKINRFHGLPPTLIRKFAIQILRALSFIRHLKIIHCDLKPENILLKHENKAGLKIIDFGSACFENAKVYTYIQSRFYRAPEIILGLGYTPAIDMWSFGCILIELAIGIPAFPGENEKDQLGLFMEVLGVPPTMMLNHSPKKLAYFDTNYSPKLSANSKGRLHYPGTKSLEQLVSISDSQFLHLIHRCLDWNPATRITPEEALAHSFITQAQGMPPSAAHASRKNKSQSMCSLPIPSQRFSDFSSNGY